MTGSSARVAARLVVALAAGGVAWPGGAQEMAVTAPGLHRTLSLLAAEGERWWTRSPDPANPVACATCHHDPSATRGWAASFPKVRPLPPPHTRVMTLLQANAEAVARHYRLSDPRPAATAITAYLAALGGDRPITPGVAAGQPAFPERIRQLALSVRRGEGLVARRCQPCHGKTVTPTLVTAFPRVVDGRAESLETFLERHGPVGEPMAWDGQPMADVIAYLTSRLVGEPVGLYTRQHTRERP